MTDGLRQNTSNQTLTKIQSTACIGLQKTILMDHLSIPTLAKIGLKPNPNAWYMINKWWMFYGHATQTSHTEPKTCHVHWQNHLPKHENIQGPHVAAMFSAACGGSAS
jgi:hypothetical protein